MFVSIGFPYLSTASDIPLASLKNFSTPLYLSLLFKKSVSFKNSLILFSLFLRLTLSAGVLAALTQSLNASCTLVGIVAILLAV